MIIKRLKIAQLRAFDEAEFEFCPGMNLLVGVNGVGKSTALDALRYLLSHVLKGLSFPRYRAMMFDGDDIKAGRDFLEAEISCEAGATAFSFLLHQSQTGHIPDKTRSGEVRDQTIGTPDLTEWIFPAATDEKKLAQQLQREKSQPLAVYFSPHRSLFNLNAYKGKGEGIASAVAESLEPRQLRAQEFADWWLTREALAQEGFAAAQPPLDALQHSIGVFLDACSNLRAVKEPKTTLLIDKAGVTLDVRQLSDGERGVLALVLDLTRRLAQANPHLKNPAQEASAVVLIDELDLHLHPRWQRTIVEKLTTTFPLCQFIATTHSPQIISEIQPESLLFLHRKEGQVTVNQGSQSYGLDSNWILDHLLETPSRPQPAQQLIDKVELEMENGNFVEARNYLARLREMVHGEDGEVVRLEASIDTLEILEEDEADT